MISVVNNGLPPSPSLSQERQLQSDFLDVVSDGVDVTVNDVQGRKLATLLCLNASGSFNLST
ncbi:hypothetical protein DPMN_129898 [Dreissena polymorpha]|uniref:Uncharacterized protein n=1 Tax=Dreissena polymorpha TaxID=45954 RepID=A0A9D4H442_DREPO|nr:hypothetical protein DPMN_129898 [Dreissena polymorpha]